MNKFKFIIDGKYLSPVYTIEEILEKSEWEILEDTDRLLYPCTCQFTESVNHCECEPPEFTEKITGKMQSTGAFDKNGVEIYKVLK